MGTAQAGLKTAVITKLFPTRSHTVAAQVYSIYIYYDILLISEYIMMII